MRHGVVSSIRPERRPSAGGQVALRTAGKVPALRLKQSAQIVLLAALRGYKWAISPLFPPACRYLPTCSEYAMEAVEHHGVTRGSLMAIWRLLRCHPLSQGGYDPVDRADFKTWGMTIPSGTRHGT